MSRKTVEKWVKALQQRREHDGGALDAMRHWFHELVFRPLADPYCSEISKREIDAKAVGRVDCRRLVYCRVW
jgi:hypothetical protein